MKQLSTRHTGEFPESDSVSQPLRSILTTERGSQTFLQPTYTLYTASISAAKHYLDPLAFSIYEEQTVNRENKGRKRKRSETYRGPSSHNFQLQELHVSGFTIGQVWEQAKRVLESSEAAIERDVTKILASVTESAQLSDHLQDDAGIVEVEVGSIPDDNEIVGASGDFGHDIHDWDSNEKDRQGSSESSEMQSDVENTLAEETSIHDQGHSGRVNGGVLVQDRYGLNDGFFSIDDFNRQTEILEQQDARGSPDADAASDEEDVDWAVDPGTTTDQVFSAGGNKLIRGGSLSGDDQDSDEHTDDGPTFGDADLDAVPEFDEDASSSAEPEGDDSLDNTNAIKYADFFVPPSIKSDSKRLREYSSPPDYSAPSKEDIQKDIEVAMSDVRRDLFDSDESEEENETRAIRSDDPRSRQSTHEKVKAKLADEIRRLETANVSKRDWTLSGEAKAPERPLNSLIEEDLEFERVGKPVPVITNEVTEEIEDLVKRRIIAKEFDEVIRRHPDSLRSRGNSRRDEYQLDDTKPQQSLAELYETDHLKATDSAYVDPKDAKLKQEHLEISELWKSINSQLDTLSNWHYKPKTPQPNITVVSDVATISMEDARPTAGRGVNGPGMLAPQELYEPGNDGKPRGELTLKSGSSVAKQEMSREEKLRRRRREKQKMNKQAGNSSGRGASARKDQLVSNLDKAGVKIIGKDGDTKDVYGGKAKSSTSKRGDELKL